MQAFHNCRQWVNYFLHTGHLHIEGLKMSKSLKNFVTIDDALLKYSARQLRFSFLLQTWNAKLDFKDSAMQEVRSAESLLNVRSRFSHRHRTRNAKAHFSFCHLAQNFFVVVNALSSEAKANRVASDGQHHFSQPELDLLAKCIRSLFPSFPSANGSSLSHQT
jgi:cysteinyl-tRNA synthetase